jgi:hypothetical protein
MPVADRRTSVRIDPGAEVRSERRHELCVRLDGGPRGSCEDSREEGRRHASRARKHRMAESSVRTKPFEILDQPLTDESREAIGLEFLSGPAHISSDHEALNPQSSGCRTAVGAPTLSAQAAGAYLLGNGIEPAAFGRSLGGSVSTLSGQWVAYSFTRSERSDTPSIKSFTPGGEARGEGRGARGLAARDARVRVQLLRVVGLWPSRERQHGAAADATPRPFCASGERGLEHPFPFLWMP